MSLYHQQGFDLTKFGGRHVDPDSVAFLFDSPTYVEHWDFGWVPFQLRSEEMAQASAKFESIIPDLKISGSWTMDQRRYTLWKAYKLLTGKFLPYNHQLTGSCVGAGGGNMAKTLLSIQALLGLAEYRELFWLFTYGKSRQRYGSRGPGEGSTGSSYANAATQDGYIAFDEDSSLGSPTFDNGGWLTLTSQLEYKWSDGARAPDAVVSLGKTHIIKSSARCRSSADVLAAHVNGYPVTEASNFGLANMIPSPQGSPSVRLGRWDGSWSHQMYCFPAGSWVAGKEFKPIEQVNVGDTVVCHDGKLRPVLRTYQRRHSGSLVRMTVAGRGSHLPIRMTPEHPALVLRSMKVYGREFYSGKDHQSYTSGGLKAKSKLLEKHEKTKPQWVKASDIRVGDYLLMPLPVFPDDPDYAEIPNWEPSRSKRHLLPSLKVCDELAWLFGLYAADGDAVPNHRITITLNKDQLQVIERCKKAIVLLGLHPHTKICGNEVKVRVDSSELANSFLKWFGTSYSEKRLPSFLFTGWNLAEVLCGLMDGNSYCGDLLKNRWQFVTTSLSLREQITSILLFLGHRPFTTKVHWIGKPKECSNLFLVSWKDGGMSRLHRFGNFLATKVTSTIYESFAGEVYNLEVAEANSYTVNGFAVHNCDESWDHPSLGLIHRIGNNWGADVHGSPTGDEPPGGFYITASTMDQICQKGEVYAFSPDISGFPARKIDWTKL